MSNKIKAGDLIIDGQVVDTYGGDFTYRDVWIEFENDDIVFYEYCYGAKPSPTEKITDEREIEYLHTLIN